LTSIQAKPNKATSNLKSQTGINFTTQKSTQSNAKSFNAKRMKKDALSCFDLELIKTNDI
jgi:hypothetical protein